MSPLIAAIEEELSSNPLDRLLSAEELGMLDNIHTRGFASTVELGQAISPTAGMHVLDIGSGLGGPARYLAERFGCQVEGVDITAPLVAAANYLNTRWAGPNNLVNFTVGNALELPFPVNRSILCGCSTSQ